MFRIFSSFCSKSEASNGSFETLARKIVDRHGCARPGEKLHRGKADARCTARDKSALAAELVWEQ